MKKEDKKQEQVKEEPKVEKNKTAGEVQVIEVPDSTNWLASSDLGNKIDDLRTRYVLKSIFIGFGKNVVIEIFK